MKSKSNKHTEDRFSQYVRFIPLIIRICVIITLLAINIQPFLSENAPLYLLLAPKILGVLLIFGLFTPVVLIFCIALFGYIVAQNTQVIFQIHLLFSVILLLSFGSFYPSLDNLLNLPLRHAPKYILTYSPLLIRLAAIISILALAHDVLAIHNQLFLSVGIILIATSVILFLATKTRIAASISLVVVVGTLFYTGISPLSYITLFALLLSAVILGDSRSNNSTLWN